MGGQLERTQRGLKRDSKRAGMNKIKWVMSWSIEGRWKVLIWEAEDATK